MTNGFDRLLRESLVDQAAANEHGECLDATLLAAWFDGTVSHAERQAVEQHASSCSRCQAMIAALVRTNPPLPRVWWRAPAVRWLVPVALVAASLVLWIGVFRPDRPGVPAPASASSMARVQSPAPGASAAAGAGPAAQGQSAAFSRPGDARAAAKAQVYDAAAARQTREPAGAAAGRDTEPQPARAAESTRPAPPSQSEPAGERVEGAQPASESRAAPAPQSPAPPAPQSPRTATDKASTPTPAPAPQGGAGAIANATVTTVQVTRVPSRDAAQPLSGNVAESVSIGGSRARVTAPAIVSADPTVRWRIAGAGQVERSIDSGVTWQAQSTGVTVVFSAGMAPSANVCWLVGRGGVVLKTADGGQTWTRVSVPGDADLVAVAANDGNVARVTAAGGRQLYTTDGGRTWR